MLRSKPKNPATPDRENLTGEIKANFAKFKTMNFDESEKGKFALLRHGKLVEILDSKMDAHKYARLLYNDGLYSIQEIHAQPIDFGWMTHAVRRSC